MRVAAFLSPLRSCGLAGLLAAGAGAAGAQAPAPAAPEPAQLWAYVDGAGVAHFADQALDSRYLPVLREPGQLSLRVPGKTMSGTSLLTWLDFAPEVKRLAPLLREAEQATGVDAELLKAMIAVESGFRADLVSPRGAVGLMQLTPAAAQRYSRPDDPAAASLDQRLRDPRANIMLGARMLADLNRRYGGMDVALAAWNAGEGRVRQAGGRVPAIEETRAHVHMVLELYWTLLQQRLQGGVRQMKLVGWTEGAASPR